LTFFINRRKRLLLLAKDKGVVVSKPGNLFYVSDFFGGGVGIVKPDRTLIITNALERDRARSLGEEVEVLQAGGNSEIWELVRKNLDGGTCYIDEDLAVRKIERFVRNEEIFLQARRTKDEEEVRRIRRASAILDKIFEVLEREIKAGRTERQLAAEIVKTAILEGATTSGFQGSMSPTILASGRNGALPHSEITDRKIKSGDFVVADLTFRYEGYNSDATRTFAVNRASSDMKRNYEAVREAQMRGVKMSREGVRCGDVHEGVAAVLREHSLGKYFVHGMGHGVGIDVHEQPFLRKGSETRLETNDVVTVEPGVYFSGKYGIRIEDTLHVKNGPITLNRYTKELVTVG
jgi:Xaa-Pro aminopeptidase/Xaa-Pro dipeptidase